ncbi:Hypp2311 [Branchiostoma lanceolatum]|uniref:Hypp2311 protein n=1 Tax=Branchiostoma lanceolatum TaxID=7740 RepID=A0A8K0EPJ1_BRALA|nr:Hypp2311 [Branchiostoma lanceolatum]
MRTQCLWNRNSRELDSQLDTVWTVNWTLCGQSTGHCVDSKPDTVWTVNWTLCGQSTGHCVDSQLDTGTVETSGDGDRKRLRRWRREEAAERQENRRR